jgi:hypothetical protein
MASPPSRRRPLARRLRMIGAGVGRGSFAGHRVTDATAERRA